MIKNAQITNPVYKDLKKLKLIKDKNLFVLFPNTRDKKIKVIKDKISEVIFLEKNMVNERKYKDLPNENYLINFTKKINKKILLDDDVRRYSMFKKIITDKEILDYGCGWGGFLSLANKLTKNCEGYEPMEICNNYIKKTYNYNIHSNKYNLCKKKFDRIFMFHVLEHIPNQLDELKFIKKLLKNKGKLIIEVPHARDLLILNNDLSSFKKFTFWSEHLVLHTKNSLKTFLINAGFKNIKILNYQRYNLNNHFKWFLEGKPGGHKIPLFKISKNTEYNYEKFLLNKNYSDTIIASAEVK